MILRKFLPLLGVALVGGLHLASAGVIRVNVADSLYTELAAQPAFASVGSFYSGSNVLQGSGTLVAGDWVLTAAHVAASLVASQSVFNVGGSGYVASQVVIHPSYQGLTVYDGADIALVRLVGIVGNVTPAALNLTLQAEEGQVAIFTGFGSTGTGDLGETEGTGGTKRAGENKIDPHPFFALPSQFMLADFDETDEPVQYPGDINELGSSEPLALEILPGRGDSGGGVFIDFGGGYVLSGVNSFVVDENGNDQFADYGDLVGAIRVSAYRDFILTTIPEPGGAAFLALASAGVLLRRRRKG